VIVAIVVLCLLVACLACRGRRRREATNAADNYDGATTKQLGEDESEGLMVMDDDPRRATARSEDDDEEEDEKASAHQFPKPVYIRPYAMEKSDDDPADYTSDGDIVSIGSSQIITPKKHPHVKSAMAPLPVTTTMEPPPTTTDEADPSLVAKSGKESLRSYQYDASRLGEVISKTKQGKQLV
jgi:hypothetical protein